MSYKTILVHVAGDRHANQRISLAASIANAEHAHLVGAAPTGVSRFVYQSRYVYQGTANLAPHLEQHIAELREHAGLALNTFETIAQRVGVRSYESRAVDDEAGAGLCLQARYADLVIIGQADRDDPQAGTLPDFPEYVVLNSGRPVLVVPSAGNFEQAGKRVLVAWDASASATRAVTMAIPVLKRAQNVDVVVFNSNPGNDEHGEQPGGDIALYLARHDVKVNVLRHTTKIDIGNALLSLAADQNSDMIVMGCYGHSRFREILLGGVTRTVLETMTVPVLMAHDHA